MNNISGRCLGCRYYVWLKPLPDETFAFCGDGETVKDVDLESGVSPAINRHLYQGAACGKFKRGPSISETDPENPFVLHPVRHQGEQYIFKNSFCGI